MTQSYDAGFYDLSLFNTHFIEQFAKNPRYNPAALSSMDTLVAMINRDPGITDVRWGAYMLATVMWETTSLLAIETSVRNRKGHLLVRHGKHVMVKRREWLMTMAPVEEAGHGAGRRYHEPVKVAAVPDGGARVTEQDGDQFSVSPTGVVRPLTKKARMGATDGAATAKIYDDDRGDENAYYGRGYVQLTWWSNYATTGVALGRGLDLLLNPDLVKEPETAYAVMSLGMRTGFGFANKHKFSDFFSGENRDYRHARKMVNGMDHAEDIARLARTFERVLLDSRVWIRMPPPFAPELAGAPSRWNR